MASISLGKVAFTWKDTYESLTEYNAQDVVSYEGNTYVCTLDGTSGIIPTNTNNWDIFAQGVSSLNLNSGELIYHNGTGLTGLANGTNGSVLTIVNGEPTWQYPTIRLGTKVKKLPENANGKQNFSNATYAAIMDDDRVRIWGYDLNGKMGQGVTQPTRGYPVRPGFPSSCPGISKIYLSYNTISKAIDLNNNLWLWGYNGHGAVGDGTTTQRPTPFNVTAFDHASNALFNVPVKEVAQYGGVQDNPCTVALDFDGNVYSAGYNAYGQLGDGTAVSKSFFSQVVFPNNEIIESISGGRESYAATYAIDSTGKLWGWGYNGDYNLGIGNVTNQLTPVAINGGSLAGKTVTGIFGTYLGAFALCSDNTLHAWGNNAGGDLGTGSTGLQVSPTQVLSNVSQVFAGTYDYQRAFVIKLDGTAWACGAGNYSARGTNSSAVATTFEEVPTRGTVQKIAMGGTGSYNTAMFLLDDGSIQSVGYNGYGQLGDGTATNRTSLVDVLIDAHIADIAAYGGASTTNYVLLDLEGNLYTTGYGGSEANTDEDSSPNYVPQPVIF